MPNIQDSSIENFDVTESRVWKILPEFMRKKSGTNNNKKQRVTEICNNTKTDDSKDVTTAAQDLTTKRQLGCRKSWTYGDRRSCDRCQTPTPETEPTTCSNKHVRSVKELQREYSFPGKFSSGSLTKNEAQRRLQSWKKTTIVRKNSEQQYHWQCTKVNILNIEVWWSHCVISRCVNLNMWY